MINLALHDNIIMHGNKTILHENVEKLVLLSKEKKIPYKMIGFVDADQNPINTLSLLGKCCPEKQVMLDLIKNTPSLEALSSMLNVDKSILLLELEKIITNPNHREWLTSISERYRLDSNTLWSYLSFIWVRNCLAKEEAEKIVCVIKESLDI